MDKKILLTIEGSHKDENGENIKVQLITEGRLFQENGVYHIEYEESEISGIEGTTARISINDNAVSFERTGTSYSSLLFESGKKYAKSLLTPYGAVQMEIYPTQIEHALGDTEGKLNLKYQIAIDGKSTGANELTFSYK
jgi:uncharacterized beta-barrel protein YwiB (DUF1934 family)